MRWPSLLAIVAILVAGCSSEPRALDPPLPVAETTLAFDVPVALPQLLGAAEPNIARLPDGTLFVTAPVGGSPKPNMQEGAAYLWRSSDGGASWETLRGPHLQAGPATAPDAVTVSCSCDADVVTSPDGWVYYSDWWIAGFFGPGNYLVESSSDGGETWTANSVPVPQDLVASMDRQWLVAGPDGFVGLFYSFFGPTPVGSLPVPVAGLDRPGQQIAAVFSHDHGATWSDPAPVVPARANVGYQIGHPFLAPNGTLMMAYGATTFGSGGFWLDASEVRLAYSMDLGATWQDTLLAGVPLGFDNLWAVQGAVDATTGLATVAWASRTDGVAGNVVDDASRMSVQVIQFGAGGRGDAVTLRADGLNFLPWVAAENGTTVVGWYGGNATGVASEQGTDEPWFAYAAVAREGGRFAHACDPDGGCRNTFSVAMVDPQPVKLGGMCPKGAACRGDRELLDYVSMVVAPDGAIHYAYARSTGSDAFVHTVAGRLGTVLDAPSHEERPDLADLASST